MLLDTETFKTVVASTPLISIDLVVYNPAGEILVGMRTNRPAQGFWFVPGGRVLKDEQLADAFLRLSEVELGRRFDISDAQFLGVYEHLYEDSALDEAVSTHYVVLGYLLQVEDPSLLRLTDQQHRDTRWLSLDAIEVDCSVHSNTQAYVSAIRNFLSAS